MLDPSQEIDPMSERDMGVEREPRRDHPTGMHA